MEEMDRSEYSKDWQLSEVTPYLLKYYFKNKPTTNRELREAFWRLMGKNIRFYEKGPLRWTDKPSGVPSQIHSRCVKPGYLRVVDDSGIVEAYEQDRYTYQLGPGADKIISKFEKKRFGRRYGKELIDEEIRKFLGEPRKEDNEVLSEESQRPIEPEGYGMDSNDVTEKFREFKEKGYIEFITFHPSYSYEEFMEGITVHTEKEGEPTDDLHYVLKSGIFKTMCKRALASAVEMKSDITDGVEWKTQIDGTPWEDVYDEYCSKRSEATVNFNSAQKYVLIIDEINRGDISKIFGELVTLLEKDKRLGAENELTATLPYSRDTFGVPPNLYIIGTMNTADRSIALLDVALRRRFGFKEMTPDFSILEEHIEKNKATLEKGGVYDLLLESIEALETINQRICQDRAIGRDKQIGHSYLFHVTTSHELIMAWQYEILPLLEEYCYGNYGKVNEILFNDETDSKWIEKEKGILGFKNKEGLKEFIEKNKPS